MDLADKKVLIKNAWLERCREFPWLYKNTLFLSIHGSTSYGLDIETSDVDMTGVCVPPRDYYLGFLKTLDQIQSSKPDGQIYNIKKFFYLASENNPNVMELLWIDPTYWIMDHNNSNCNIWDMVLDARNAFLSKKVRYTYSGYAVAQLKRIETHRRWLLHPPIEAPTREQFKLPPERILSRDQQGALDQMAADGLVTIEENFMHRLQQENAFDQAKREWKQFNTWKETRNPARAMLEAQYGYDTKHASHLVRLIRQCREILSTGKVNVQRKDDREEILAIKRGAWTYEVLMDWVDREASEKVLDDLYEKSSLPHDPDRNRLDQLCVDIVERVLYNSHV